ncbi:MAG: hypothetical protein ACKO3P_21210, partial [Planctomycetaceae bacterium]
SRAGRRRRSGFHGLDFDVDLDGAFLRALVLAARGGHVGVVPSDGDLDVAVVGLGAVGGIEGTPAKPGQVDLGPCVGGIGAWDAVEVTINDVRFTPTSVRTARGAKVDFQHAGATLRATLPLDTVDVLLIDR